LSVITGVAAAFMAAGLHVTAASAADLETVEIATKQGVRIFTVEVVNTEADRAKGLMFRKTLPEGTGMLFDFKVDQPVSFWMRNTLIPLDMIFIRSNGEVANVHENAKPMDETPIPSAGPVRTVLEIIGGSARKLGIAAGDQVALPSSMR
jgi:uncharacterized membrane protein (UPF0127 family)